MQNYANIQALRAVAALMVVWAHLKEIFPSNEIVKSLPSGIAGVDLFFVISGFIMVVSTERRNTNPVRFIINRFIRISPLYYLFTLFMFTLATVAPSLLKSTQNDVGELVLSLLYIPFFKSDGNIYPTFFLGWSLNYEMFFYVVFAIAMSFGHQARILLTAIIISLLVVIGYLLPSVIEGGAAIFSYTRSIMGDFVLGMLIARFSPLLGKTAANRTGLFVAILIIGAAGIIFTRQIFGVAAADVKVINPTTDTFFRYGIFSAMIVAAAVALESTGRKVTNRLLLAVGDASYSLYLVHFLVASFAIVIANKLQLSDLMRALLCVPTVILAVIAAYACLVLVERPMTELGKSLMTRKTRPA